MSQSRIPLRSPRVGPSSASAVTEDSVPSTDEDETINSGLSHEGVSIEKRSSLQPQSAGASGVRYISESLVLRASRQQDLATVFSLNLSNRTDNRKIRFIENLDKLKNLQSLTLSFNIIEKMEHLDKLVRLRELNLAHNRIGRIDCFEALTQLRLLNLTGNLIASLPAGMARRLKCLDTLLLGDNKIESLSEPAKLRLLANLATLSLSGNPISDLEHYRPYLLFCLPSLAKLDGRPVAPLERAEADARFRQDEADRLQIKLEEAEFAADELRAQLLTYEEEVGELNGQVDSALEQQDEREREREDLLQQLRLKDSLLQKKTEELAKASRKHYELEQELVFYKMDEKFGALGRAPGSSIDSDDAADGAAGGTGESPYIGKARYIAAAAAATAAAVRFSPPRLSASQHELSTPSADRPNPSPLAASPQLLDYRQRVLAALDRRLAQRRDQLDRADATLTVLREDAAAAEARLRQARQAESELQAGQRQLRAQLDASDRQRRRLEEELLKERAQSAEDKRLALTAPEIRQLGRQLEQRREECANLRQALADESAGRAAAEQRAARLESSQAAAAVASAAASTMMSEPSSAAALAAAAAAEIDRRLKDWLAGGESDGHDDEDVVDADKAETGQQTGFGTDSLGQALNRLKRAVRNRTLRSAASTPVTPVTPLTAGRLQAPDDNYSSSVTAMPDSPQKSAVKQSPKMRAQTGDRFEEQYEYEEAGNDDEGPDDSGQGDSLLNLTAESASGAAGLSRHYHRPAYSSAGDDNRRLLARAKQTRVIEEEEQDEESQLRPLKQNKKQQQQQQQQLFGAKRNTTQQPPEEKPGEEEKEEERVESRTRILGKQADSSSREASQNRPIRLPTEAELLKRGGSGGTYRQHSNMLASGSGRRRLRSDDDSEAADEPDAAATAADDFYGRRHNEARDDAEDARPRKQWRGATRGTPAKHQQQQQPRVSIVSHNRPVNPWSSDDDDDDDYNDLEDHEGNENYSDAERGERRQPPPRRPTSLPPPGPSARSRAGGSRLSLQQQQQQQQNPRQPKRSLYEPMSSGEEGVFNGINRQLTSLKRSMSADLRHSRRLEAANARIQQLEADLRRRDMQAQRSELERAREQDRSAWEKEMMSTVFELKRAQETIDDLTERLRDRESAAARQASSAQAQTETAELGRVLDAQRAEIIRLNDLLDRLVGVRCSADSAQSVPDFAQVQRDVFALRHNFARATAPYSHLLDPQQQQQPLLSPKHRWSVPNHLNLVGSAGAEFQPNGFGMDPAAAAMLSASAQSLQQQQQQQGLFCNVPEHHDLEDYLHSLQDRVASLRRRLRERRRSDNAEAKAELQRLDEAARDKRARLQDCRDELDLRRRALEEIRAEAAAAERQRDAAQEQLVQLEARVAAVAAQRELQSREEAHRLEEERAAGVAAELRCLDASLAKRQGELAACEKQLGEARLDLDTVKRFATDAVNKSERASAEYARILGECEELGRRSAASAKELARANEELQATRRITIELEAEKSGLERTLADAETLLKAKDEQFQEAERRIQQAEVTYQDLQRHLASNSYDDQRLLCRLDEASGQLKVKRDEMAAISAKLEAKRKELAQLEQLTGQQREQLRQASRDAQLRREQLDGEAQRAARDLAELETRTREQTNRLAGLREETAQAARSAKAEEERRDLTRAQLEKDKEELQSVSSQAAKQKQELSRLLDLTEAQRAQLAQMSTDCSERSAALASLTAALAEARRDLKEAETARQRQTAELERLREAVGRENEALELLTSDKRNLEALVAGLKRERDSLAEARDQCEQRGQQLRRQLTELEDSLASAQTRLDKAEQEAAAANRGLDRLRADKTQMQKEIAQLQDLSREANQECSGRRGRLAEAESQLESLAGELRSRQREKDDLCCELRRVQESIRANRLAAEEAAGRLSNTQQELSAAETRLAERQAELQEAGRKLARARSEAEKEEARLAGLLASGGAELDSVRADLALRQEELRSASAALGHVRRECEAQRFTANRCGELEAKLAELSHETAACQRDKQELAQALNRSYKEITGLREQCVSERQAKVEAVHSLEQQALRLRDQLARAAQELEDTRRRDGEQAAELERTGREQRKRAERLTDELSSCRQELVKLKKQVSSFGSILFTTAQEILSQEELIDRERRVVGALRSFKDDLDSGRFDLEAGADNRDFEQQQQRMSAAGSRRDQRQRVQTHLTSLRRSLSTTRAGLEAPVSSSSAEVAETGGASLKEQLQRELNQAAEQVAMQYQRSHSSLRSLRLRLEELETSLQLAAASN